VHFTPGHSPDHVCLFVPARGYLFTGDLFLAERLRFLRRDEDLTELITSLERMAALPAERVFCAHRGLVKGGTDALRRKAQHLSALRADILEGLQRGRGPGELARRLVGREGLLSVLSLGHFSARNFVHVLARQAGAHDIDQPPTPGPRPGR
jgi:glyoxylase-like metal-dependent hydrolase (beta-lactamase superfamily II)